MTDEVTAKAEYEALVQRIVSLQEWAHSEHDSMEKLFNQRVSSIERAVEVAHADLVRVPTDVEKEVTALRELMESRMLILDERFMTMLERFNSIQTQFKERDARTEQTAKDAKTAIDAALLAAEKAVGKQQDANNEATRKSDFSFTKQIDQQGVLIAAVRDGLNASISEVKDRISRVESTREGRTAQRTETRDDGKLLIAIAGLILTTLGIAIGYFLKR